MSDVPSRADLFRIARDEILTLNPQLATEVVEEPGSDANILIAGAVAAGDEVVGQVTRLAAGLFLDSAAGAALDRLVFDRYSLTRKPAAPGVGSVNFYLPAVPASSFVIPAGTVLAAQNGAQFVTTAAVTFPTNTSGLAGSALVVAPVRSLLAGSAQQAATGTITAIVSFPGGSPVPTNVTGPLQVTNSLATAGASDAETDTSLRARARNFFSTARRGTLSAIQQAALAVPGVQTATAFEITDGGGTPARFVQLVVADQFTQLLINYSPTGALLPVNYQAQSQVLAANVASALLDVRAAGIYVGVLVANVQLLPVVLSLTFLAGAQNPDQSAFLARGGVVAYINGLGPTQNFDPAACAAAVFPSVPGLDPTNSQIISPAGVVEAQSQTQVFRTTLQLVTAASASASITLP